MIQFNTTSSSTVKYYIAQYIQDPIRRESINVGVVVQKGNSVVARFLGEKQDSEGIDNRALRHLASPKGYRAWVHYWRRVIRSEKDWEKRILQEGGTNFLVIPGGEVSETGADACTEVCNYLYSTIVSRGGLAEALGEQPDDNDLSELKSDVVGVLKMRGIMASGATARTLTVRHPIYQDREVCGRKRWHNLGLVQERERELWAADYVNFASKQKTRAKERAGYLSQIFADIGGTNEMNKKFVHTLAIVRVLPEDSDNRDVKYGLEVLKDTCSSIVNWLDKRERDKYCQERELVAFSQDP